MFFIIQKQDGGQLIISLAEIRLIPCERQKQQQQQKQNFSHNPKLREYVDQERATFSKETSKYTSISHVVVENKRYIICTDIKS